MDRVKWHEESLYSVPPDLESTLSTSFFWYSIVTVNIFLIYMFNICLIFMGNLSTKISVDYFVEVEIHFIIKK